MPSHLTRSAKESGLASLPMTNTPDTDVFKAGDYGFLAAIDIPQVDQDLARHDLPKASEIQRAELLPLGHDYHCVGVFGTGIGISRVRDIRKQLASLVHASRIASANGGAHVLQRRDQRNGRRVTHIVAI